ncbi:NAD(P)/FAD-dependent oxidoreductase [Dictyobacter formicarum]|uniref:Pyridine nucleotide-disulfide oxidoreductase n=1 Tax=Dictyobacter formicarum TaxID=2778368 RepID=A0ABQ3V9M9_9CHLR|nr:NAD(P)/FAD-dependent oxidoreductase [Dictyobacter formicarum]GHO82128.1 pyridine nucleotide-disulfide oxidoreductase [Dictyobacter formicarum]
MFDVIIIGAGPAGMSAALMLGRCCRSVLICDNGQPRNVVSHAMHGFLTRDGIAPAEFRRIGKEQLQQYTNVEVRSTTVIDAKRESNFFTVTLSDESIHTARILLLATGLKDVVPPIEGFRRYYGAGVFSCPYCDAWEVRDQPLAVFGQGPAGEALALQLLQWSRDIILCTNGPSQLDARKQAFLHQHNIRIHEEPIARLEGTEQRFESIVFVDGTVLPRRAIFIQTQHVRRLELLDALGCTLPEKYQEPIAPGIYLAGDVYQTRWVSGAVADGVELAVMINMELQKEELTRSYQALKEA